MRLMPTVCFLPLPREMPVDPWLSPEVKMDYCRRTACLALYTFHTHHFSIIRLIHRGKTCTCAHTCPNINTGLKALMGLLAKGHCQDSDKSFFRETKTCHIQLHSQYTRYQLFVVFLSLSIYMSLSVSLSSFFPPFA